MRVELGKEKQDIPSWDVTGLAGLPHNTAWEMWRALRQWQIPYTVYIEQPPEYWQAMFTLEALYATKHDRLKPPDTK